MRDRGITILAKTIYREFSGACKLLSACIDHYFQNCFRVTPLKLTGFAKRVHRIIPIYL